MNSVVALIYSIKFLLLNATRIPVSHHNTRILEINFMYLPLVITNISHRPVNGNENTELEIYGLSKLWREYT
jgi:hypothetical protein